MVPSQKTIVVNAERVVCGAGPSVYGKKSNGKKCYEVLFGRKKPCEGCPLEKVLLQKKVHSFKWSPFSDLPAFHITQTPILDSKGNVLEVIEDVELAGRSDLINLLELGLKELSIHHQKEKKENATNKEIIEEEKTLLSLAAHQMQHPVGLLRGYLELYLQNPNKENEQVLQEELKSLSSLIQNMLGMSNNEVNSKDVRRETVEIVELMKEWLEDFCSKGKCKNRVKLIAKGPIYFYTDKWRFREGLQVLLENAVKYSSEGGLIEIKVQEKEDCLHLEIFNEGQGIAPENLKKIFDPFFRENKHVPGAGLGLSLLKKIVDRRGGKIWAESVQGSWAKIICELPKNLPKN